MVTSFISQYFSVFMSLGTTISDGDHGFAVAIAIITMMYFTKFSVRFIRWFVRVFITEVFPFIRKTAEDFTANREERQRLYAERQKTERFQRLLSTATLNGKGEI